MGIFEHNPYTNIHNMNLDWMLRTVQEASTDASSAKATAESMEDDLQTAMTNASTALTTANSAASDAALALSTANNALNTASAAQSTANTAQSTANTAVTNAATAQSTANTAVTNAATAQSTADTAVSNASTAQTTAASAVTAAANALTEAESKLPASYAVYDGTVNLLKLNISSQTSIPGVTHTVNANGTITLNGEATSDSTLLLGRIDTMVGETYTVSGATGGSDSTYYLHFAMHPVAIDYGSGDTETCDSAYNSGLYLDVKNGTSFDNVTISPMVRFEAVESSFKKYVSTNKELEDAVDDKLDAPTSAGTAGQVLSLDSNLSPVWADASGGSAGWTNLGTTTLDASTTSYSFTVPTTTTEIEINYVIARSDTTSTYLWVTSGGGTNHDSISRVGPVTAAYIWGSVHAWIGNGMVSSVAIHGSGTSTTNFVGYSTQGWMNAYGYQQFTDNAGVIKIMLSTGMESGTTFAIRYR